MKKKTKTIESEKQSKTKKKYIKKDEINNNPTMDEHDGGNECSGFLG